ncbi:hypothetical protein ACQJBY_062686 [Aegilops geniculata]
MAPALAVPGASPADGHRSRAAAGDPFLARRGGGGGGMYPRAPERLPTPIPQERERPLIHIPQITPLHPLTGAGRNLNQDWRLEREGLVSPGSQAMDCPLCKNPPAVCGDLEGPSCHISVPMTTFYWGEAFIPCCNRRVIGACIEHLQSIAARENKPMCKTIFVTRELLEYEVMLDHGAKKTMIHGEDQDPKESRWPH